MIDDRSRRSAPSRLRRVPGDAGATMLGDRANNSGQRFERWNISVEQGKCLAIMRADPHFEARLAGECRR